jgi:molybdopterin converting factor subunit 1
MKVKVLIFAALAERLGVREVELALSAVATVDEALRELCVRYPGLADKLDGVAVAVNLEYVGRDTPLHDGDELALIPPVSGG